jgi:hypothetical protein
LGVLRLEEGEKKAGGPRVGSGLGMERS